MAFMVYLIVYFIEARIIPPLKKNIVCVFELCIFEFFIMKF